MSSSYKEMVHQQRIEGIDALEKKAGQDPSKLRQVNEKVVRTTPPPFLLTSLPWLKVKKSSHGADMVGYTDRLRPRHVREGHRQERARQGLQLEMRMLACS